MTRPAPFTAAQIARAIRAADQAGKVAGVKKTAHGLRKTRATVLAEGGATASQIAAWTGHKTLAEVEHYTREYDRMRAVMG